MTDFRRQLFNEYEATNEEGRSWNDKINDALMPLVIEANRTGIALRDLESLFISSITCRIGEQLLLNASKRYKETKGLPRHD